MTNQELSWWLQDGIKDGDELMFMVHIPTDFGIIIIGPNEKFDAIQHKVL